MLLYFAGSAGGGGGTVEHQLYAAGGRRRLVSYYDISATARTDGQGGPRGQHIGKFWISTPQERDDLMKLYVAGNGKSKGSAHRDYTTGARNRLLSYAFLKDWATDEFEYWVDGKPQAVSVFLDSGAFSAHTLGRKIDLVEYCEYVEQHKDALAAYAVLDIIGDSKGTLKNLHAMRARGLDPVAIYHVGSEKLDVLEQVLSDKSAYVALGGMASDRPTREELQAKLDPCWKILEKHWPVKVHGLGVMAQWALERYPWYSVDSSSAIVGAGMGRVMRMDRKVGQQVANGWKDDVRATLDGKIADGIGRVKSAESKSASAHEGRRTRNIEAQIALERHVTRLWASRGVEWSDV